MAELASWGPSYTGGAPCFEDTTHKASLRAEFGVDVRIFLPKNWQRSWHPDVPRDIVTWIADAVRATMRKLQPVMQPMDMNVILLETVFQSSPDDWDIGTFANTLRRTPCPISLAIISAVYRGDGATSGSTPRRDLQAYVAHEVLHCYQFTHFRDQYVNVEATSRAWWIESTAEYVAQDLYPCSRVSLNQAENYDASLPVFRQRYPNYVFFQHLEDKYRFDPRTLAAFMESMPTGPGGELQRQALAAWPGISDKWHTFARALQDAEFPDCIAAHLNSVAVVTEVDVSQRVSISAVPFTAAPHGLRFKEKSRYQFWVKDKSGSRHSGSSGPNKVSYRAGTEWRWAEVNGDPVTVETGCDEEKTYMFVVTSARSDVAPYKVTIEVTRTPQEILNCCVDTRQHDRCVVGSWELDKDQMLALLRRLNPKAELEAPHGELRTVYEANGNIRGTNAKLLFTGRLRLNSGLFAPFSVSIAGQGTGRWSTDADRAGRQLHTCATRNESAIDTRIDWPRLPSDGGRWTPPGSILGLSLYYECDRDSLTLLLPGNRMKQFYRRVAP